MGDDQIRFGRFRVDLVRRELWRDGERAPLGNRALDILCMLASANGDVVSKDELLARVWPDRIVEESNILVHVSALRKALEEGKDGRSHIVTVPGHGYRLIGIDRPVQVQSENDTSQNPTIPDLPSIAVLPFANMSGDPEQEYFADGIVEEIITGLSRMRRLFVIARNSSFTYKGRAVDVRQVGRDLGVRYVLEGSVRKAENRVRITGQLVDASTGAHLWADRFDGRLEDIFDLQDQVTASVIGAIAPRLEQAEIERSKRKSTDSLDAYDYFLRGMANVYQWTKEGSSEALLMFHRAVELDPKFTTAHGMTAWCYLWRYVNGWTVDLHHETGEAVRLAKWIAEAGRDDAVALSFGGMALAYVGGDPKGGALLADRALALNPNLSTAWIASGWARAFLGDTNDATAHLARAMRLSPLDPLMFLMQTVTALASFIAGQYSEAASWAARAIDERPNFLAALRLAAASNARCGRLNEAQSAIARAQHFDPNLRISNLRDRVGPYRPADFARFSESLRMAGLPE
jgi:TolB-like protein